MSRTARIAQAWGLNSCLPTPPGRQVRTAPDAPPPASGAGVLNPVAKASEDNGRKSATMGDPVAGEASRGNGVADRQRSSLPGFTGEDGGRGVEASGGTASVITLSDASAFILSLIAAYEGKPAGEIIAQLIVGAAEAIGIYSLILRDAVEIDLADVPDFARQAANRFRGCGP